MMTYEKISKKPQLAHSLIGMSLAEFDDLYTKLEIAHSERESALPYTRRQKTKRQRAIGAGRKHQYALRDRLLMTLLWLRIHTTYEVLGRLFGVSKTTAARYIKDVHDSLVGMPGFRSGHSPTDIPKLRSVQEVMNALPDIRWILDVHK